MTDAVRAVEAVRSLPTVTVDSVSVQGVSQGGGLALAVAGLVPDLWLSCRTFRSSVTSAVRWR